MQRREYDWNVRVRGTGPDVLLLHAFPYDARMWDGQSEQLAASHRVLVPDMPGFAGAQAWPGVPSIDAWATDLLENLRSLGVAGAIVAGCSMGGYLAFALLRAAPDFVRGLAIVDSRVIPDSADRKAARLGDAERIVREGPAFFIERSLRSINEELSAYPAARALASSMLSDASSQGLADALVALATRPDATAQLISISVPAVVVRGVRDPIVGRDEARVMAASIKGATFVEIDGAGHIPSFERPDEIAVTLLDLCSRCAS